MFDTDHDMLPIHAFAGGRGTVRGYSKFAMPMTYEGGKGSSAPPPDPRLIEAQVRSMGYQDQFIQQIMANTERFAPLQMEQMQFGLDAARRAQRESAEDREFMLSRRGMLAGMQDRLVQDANLFNTEQRRKELAAQAGADVQQAFSQARAANARQMARMGINPNDGRQAAMGNQMAAQEALAGATARNQTRSQARQEGYALTDRATNALAGYPAMGMQATSAGAGFGMAGQGIAAQGLAGLNAGLGQAGQMAGQMGQNATNMWNAQANYQANMQSGDTLGGILGGLGGVIAGGAKAGFWSDRRLKQDIEQAGVDEATGLPLYEFSYKSDPGRRFVGVMSDDVRKVRPDAVSADENGFDRVDYDKLGLELKEVA